MKKLTITILGILALQNVFSQLANINYSARTVNVTSYENATGGACWEMGNEEYTAYLGVSDDAGGAYAGTGCQTCDANGNCSYAANIQLITGRINSAYTLNVALDAWEDDCGSRCGYGSCFLDNDDCRRNETSTYKVREATSPSASTYTNSPTYGGTNNHVYTVATTWKYVSGGASLTPCVTPQTTTANSGAIRSWAVVLTAGITYNFQTCGSTEDAEMNLYGTDGYTVLVNNDDGCSLQSTITYTPITTGTYFVELGHFSSGRITALTSNNTLTYSITNIGTGYGDPTVYGTNTWNIYTYYGSNFTTYAGYATNSTSSEFNIGAFGMGATSNPTVLGGYVGFPLCSNDNWSLSAKRQGFPCAVYNVNLVAHDDDYVLNIDYDGNGTVDFTSSAGCCGVGLGTKWTGVLNSASRVEIQLKEGGGDAYIDIDFVNITPAIGGGTISGITNGVTICNNTDPGSFSTSGVASGGTVGYTNGGSYTYQWENSTTSSSAGFTNISAATSQTYNPGNLTATTWFRRKVTDVCGNTTYSNVIQVIVIPYPSGGSIATVNICSGAVGTISITGVSNATQYSWVLPAGFSGSSTTASINVTAPTVSIGTNYTINVYPQNVSGGTTCTGTAVTGTISVYGTGITVAAPSGTTPLTQCDGGDPASFSVTTPTGGNGSYSYQWQQSAGCTGTWINAVAQSGGSTSLTFDPPILTLPTTSMCYRLRVTDGCGNTAFSAIKTYNIVADPAAPSATKSPNVATVCVGQALTLTGAAQGGGGTGTCNIEYATSTNGGTTYSAWSTTVPSITATGTDNRIKIRTNCTGTGCDISPEVTYTWAVVPVVSLTPSGTNVSCFGGTNGTASVLASGGTGSYTYSWYSGGSGSSISGLSAGTYTVLVSSATCSATASYTVTQPTLLVANTCMNPDLCQVGAGSVKIEVSGGTPPYTVSRSPLVGTFSPSNSITTSGGSTFINGLSNGTTLNITVTDTNGCIKP
ncbi:MAG: hypothetical protein ACKVTZ_16210 [Bacteroidia bacterium]